MLVVELVGMRCSSSMRLRRLGGHFLPLRRRQGQRFMCCNRIGLKPIWGLMVKSSAWLNDGINEKKTNKVQPFTNNKPEAVHVYHILERAEVNGSRRQRGSGCCTSLRWLHPVNGILPARTGSLHHGGPQRHALDGWEYRGILSV